MPTPVSDRESRTIGQESVSPHLRARFGVGTMAIGVVAILGLVAITSLWRSPSGGSAQSTETTSPSPVATVLISADVPGVSAPVAEANARLHVHPDAVLVSATAGRFDTAYVPLGPFGAAPADVPPSSLVWVVTFSENVVVCPPPYFANGVSEQQPCKSPRPGTISVVLDYSSGSFIRSDGYAPAP